MATQSRRNCFTKHVWRIISTAVVLIAIIAAAIPSGFSFFTANSYSTITLAISSGWYFLTIFWNIFVIRWEKAGRGIMHPAAVVALDLCICIYSCFTIAWGFVGVFSVLDQWQPRNMPINYQWSNDAIGAMICFGIWSACSIIVLVIHLGVFVVGCMEEHRRRKALKGNKSAVKKITDEEQAQADAKQEMIEQQEEDFGFHTEKAVAEQPAEEFADDKVANY